MSDVKGGIAVVGLGACIPERVRLNDAWPESFANRFAHTRTHDVTTIESAAGGGSNALDEHTAAALAPYANDPFRGTRRRHVIAPGQLASDLEVEAARQALRDAGLRPEQIDVVFVTSHMPDHMLPANGPVLQHKLGLANAICFPTDLACASFLSHLVFATAMIRTGMARYVLSVNSTTLSRFLDLNLPVSVHLGDGAAACVFAAAPEGAGLLGHFGRTDGSLRDGIVLAHTEASGKPASRFEDVTGRILFTTLDPVAGKKGGLIGASWCRESCEAALTTAGLTVGEVDYYLGAQSLKWFPDACRRALGLRPEQVIESFDEVANIGTATIPYNLLRARERNLLRAGSKLLLYAPGVGMSRIAAVFAWS